VVSRVSANAPTSKTATDQLSHSTVKPTARVARFLRRSNSSREEDLDCELEASLQVFQLAVDVPSLRKSTADEGADHRPPGSSSGTATVFAAGHNPPDSLRPVARLKTGRMGQDEVRSLR